MKRWLFIALLMLGIAAAAQASRIFSGERSTVSARSRISGGPAVVNTGDNYKRPNGTDTFRRPGGVDLYKRP